MRFNGPFRRPQLISYLLIHLAPNNKHKYLPFALGQRCKAASQNIEFALYVKSRLVTRQSSLNRRNEII
jgi:hypothetical protein